MFILCCKCSLLIFECQEFDDYKDADDAVYEMNHKEFMGERYMIIVWPLRILFIQPWLYNMIKRPEPRGTVYLIMKLRFIFGMSWWSMWIKYKTNSHENENLSKTRLIFRTPKNVYCVSQPGDITVLVITDKFVGSRSNFFCPRRESFMK